MAVGYSITVFGIYNRAQIYKTDAMLRIAGDELFPSEISAL
jgi:hypothetical protein